MHATWLLITILGSSAGSKQEESGSVPGQEMGVRPPGATLSQWEPMDHEQFVAMRRLLHVLQKILGKSHSPKTLNEIISLVFPALAFILFCLSLLLIPKTISRSGRSTETVGFSFPYVLQREVEAKQLSRINDKNFGKGRNYDKGQTGKLFRRGNQARA